MSTLAAHTTQKAYVAQLTILRPSCLPSLADRAGTKLYNRAFRSNISASDFYTSLNSIYQSTYLDRSSASVCRPRGTVQEGPGRYGDGRHLSELTSIKAGQDSEFQITHHLVQSDFKMRSAFFATLLALPFIAQAAVNGSCTGKVGVCLTTSSCSASGGTSHSGYCPNDAADVKCCTKSCGSGGTCRLTSTCGTGKTQSGEFLPYYRL